jgi:hypothetical protein
MKFYRECSIRKHEEKYYPIYDFFFNIWVEKSERTNNNLNYFLNFHIFGYGFSLGKHDITFHRHEDYGIEISRHGIKKVEIF